MRKVKIAHTIEEFEELANRKDINILQVDVKGIEPNALFQQGFVGIVYYEDISDRKNLDYLEIALEAAIRSSELLLKQQEMKDRSLFNKIKQWIHKNYGKAKS